MAHQHDHHQHCDNCSHQHQHAHQHTHSPQDQLWIIAATAVLLFIAVLIEHGVLFNLQLSTFSLLLVYLVPYLLIGHKTLHEAWEGITEGDMLNEHFLMSVATIGALCIGFLPGAETEYPEAVFVMLFFQIGELFESYAVRKSRDSIAHLMDIRPDIVHLEHGDASPEEVAAGSVITIRPGEKVPLDGVVIEGCSALNTVALTGETEPRRATVGDEVVSGCVNLSGELRVRTTKVFAESTVTKIIQLVEQAGERKSQSEAFITRFARIYTPVVVIAAIAIAILPPLFVALGQGSLTAFHAALPVWLYRALMFLVVSCPCALVISVPLTFFGGIGGASRQGILVKGANCLDVLAKVETVVFDKTGTLTLMKVDQQADGQTTYSEEVKADSAEAIRRLHALGIRRTVMLTGDRREKAERIARETGLTEYHAELLPTDKVQQVERLLHSSTSGLAFVGDGINDAPVLARADVGIAMGALGSDAAVEAADVVLMDDRPSKVALAIRIARRTLAIARQNVIFAIAVKVGVLLLAACGLATMWMAVFADVGVTVLAVLNAMRALHSAPSAVQADC